MSSLPPGCSTFLQKAGFGADAAVQPLAGDASPRRYFRVSVPDRTAMLMHAPPPGEDVRPFLTAADWLRANHARVPEVYASDASRGFVLQEDCGDRRMKDFVEQTPAEEEAAYARAIDQLARVQRAPTGPFSPYDHAAYRREVDLLIDWYCPALALDVARDEWSTIWDGLLGSMIERETGRVTVLRDYHAENIMVTPSGEQVMIDFQDALAGHPAYDLVSLLQDARRDVPERLERAMLDRYRAAMPTGPHFLADYSLLGAQRNAKIIGIFSRLARRDGKPRYMDLVPRVWRLLERDLAHPALAPLADWFDANIPPSVRRLTGLAA
jgi:aminoglycoside/choline kinase family phosphotransferase